MSSSSFSLDSRSLRSLSWEECHQRSDLRSLAALVPGGSARVTAEPSHHLLKVNRRLQSLLVDRHILIPVHGFGYRLRSLMNLFLPLLILNTPYPSHVPTLPDTLHPFFYLLIHPIRRVERNQPHPYVLILFRIPAPASPRKPAPKRNNVPGSGTTGVTGMS